MKFGLRFWFLVFCFYGTTASAQGKLDILLKGGHVTVHDSELLPYTKFEIKTYKNRKFFSFEWEFSRPLIAFDVKIMVTTPRQPIIVLMADGCQCMLKDADLPHLVKVLVETLRNGSDIPERCPIPAIKRHHINRFYLNPKSFPAITPEMNTFSNVTFINHKKEFITFHVNYEFKRI